jgi:methenyltetrahydrofolate cyclohydrolase
MAASFTLAREDHADRHARMTEIRERAGELRERLLALAQCELNAYEPVLLALRLPGEDPQRHSRVAEALSHAAQSPLAVSENAAEVAELGGELSRTATEHLVGDAITGTLLAEAACRAAGRLVEINLAKAPRDPRLAKVTELISGAAVARAKALQGFSG